MTLNEKSVQNSITQWIVDMEGAPGTLYEGEKFQLLFKFSSRYPFDSPQVMFTGENIPVHPHVYSNGHICLSILTEDWSPALSVQSVCLSIISMLSSCKEKRRPPDNSFYVRTCNKNPKKTKWWYHVFSDLVCVHTEPQARTRCGWLYPAEKVSSLTGTFFIFKLIPKVSFSYLPCHHGVLCN
ncbi:ubiquitin-conjugating enzyme E2 W isoform X2 [Pteropus vampyrus]|nr:ubiquitin-conjugating enzyme E2 W isoform X2 [Pteropus vampyrus]XP_023390368.1 ubiquitin-conjugating enzyme E2 W isoform X2 [Pteropus vampyrus]